MREPFFEWKAMWPTGFRTPNASRALGVSVAALLILGLPPLATPALADEPLRLELVRESADLEASAELGACVRGRLYVVRSFEPGDRGLWIADTLEIPADSISNEWIEAGRHAGVVRDDGEAGWRIELRDAETALVAGLAQVAQGHTIRLGRRPGSLTGPCRTASQVLEDGSAIQRRLRRLYASASFERAVEIRVRP
jgi:hypothetical protein